MKKRKLYTGKTIEYPLIKAKAILEEDGTILSEEELKRLVNVLTLLAQQEAELINHQQTEKITDAGK